jgi:hypothetical protein
MALSDPSALYASTAQEWLSLLAQWIENHGLCGYDPFDVKQHPFLRALQPYKWPRRASTACCDLFPVTVRRLLGVEPTENPKAFALVALGDLRRYETTKDPLHLDRAGRYLDWLRTRCSPGCGGMAWGYPFDVYGKGVDTPSGTPIGVVTAIAGEAFALAYDLTRDAHHLDAVRATADFFLNEIPQMRQADGTFCFAYTPTDRRRVHNANLHAVAHLYRTFRLTGDERFRTAAEPALAYTLKRQRPDGSWPYGEWVEGDLAERNLMELVDHHHTGFVLRSLYEIHADTSSADVRRVLDAGYRYYRENLFLPDGTPITAYARYPVDIHACAEAVLCPSVLADLYPDARELADAALNWTARHMRNSRTGLPYYRRYPYLTSRLVCTRWGVAWIYYALSEYLARRAVPGAPSLA